MATTPHRIPPASSDHRTGLVLGLLTLLCLVPFSGKAFHIDDPLFVWAAQQITRHPLDPYGFKVVWYATQMSMSEVTKNPPLGAYFGALVGSVAGWSEQALHLGFLLPALTLVLGTFHLAKRFTPSAWIAAAATLLTPGFMVSATSVMCDTLMLALWVVAVMFWITGLEPLKPGYLLASALLMAACPLTKYFGIALIPLLFVYTLVRLRRLGSWIFFLLVPLCALAGYQMWTHALYGRGLLWDAAVYSNSLPQGHGASRLAKIVVGLAFLGGCALPGLTFAPLLWSRRQIGAGAALSALAGFAAWRGWIQLQSPAAQEHWLAVSSQLALYFAGAISILGLAVADLWKRRDADSLLLALWIFGTFVFAALLNWTINARSILPLIPAAGIVLARRWDASGLAIPRWSDPRLVIPLMISGGLSLWAASADASLASSARTAAAFIHARPRNAQTAIVFEGHWGFQYYMQARGAQPVDVNRYQFHSGDLFVIPENNTNKFGLPPGATASGEVLEVKTLSWMSTMRPELGAGFYASLWGPLPFAFGPVAPERYYLWTLSPAKDASTPP